MALDAGPPPTTHDRGWISVHMEPVLLLNASFEPVRVINWKRALTLVFAGKVEVVEEYGREVHSVSLVVRLPAVVRLLTLIRVRASGVKFSRQHIYARDNYECQYCGCQPPVSELTYDHIIPRAHGGATDWHNIVTCCITCNRRKGGKSLDQSGLRLRHQPKKPAWQPYVTMALGMRNPPESWRGYLAWHAMPKSEEVFSHRPQSSEGVAAASPRMHRGSEAALRNR